MIYTSDLLLESIKSRAMIPDSQNTFPDSTLLNLANEEMESFIQGLLIRVQEEYGVYTIQVPLVANQQAYRIPERFSGLKLRDIVMVINDQRYYIARVSREKLPDYDPLSVDQTAGFWVQNNNVMLIWMPTDSIGYLEMSGHLRPGQIVPSTGYRPITSVDTETNTLGMDTLMTSLQVGAKIDVQTQKSGSEYVLLSATITAVDTIGKTVTVDKDVSDCEVGDYLCMEKTAAVPQCPEEMHPMLAQRVVCRVLEALNDQEGLAASSAKLKEMELNILALIDNRVEGKPLKIVNTRGLLSSGMRSNVRLGR